MKFCVKCGTFYDETGNESCPNCAELAQLHQQAEAAEVNHAMDEPSARRARKRAWAQLCIGVPAFIGFIYLIIYLIRTLRGG